MSLSKSLSQQQHVLTSATDIYWHVSRYYDKQHPRTRRRCVLGCAAIAIVSVAVVSLVAGWHLTAMQLLMMMIFCGAITGWLGDIGFTSIADRGPQWFIRWRYNYAQRYLNEHHWRPRRNCVHPSGRDDTQPRWTISRIRTKDNTVTISLHLWHYTTAWQPWEEPGTEALSQTFGACDLEKADGYVSELNFIGAAQIAQRIEQDRQLALLRVPTDDELLDKWFSDRPTTEVTDVESYMNSQSQL